MIGDFTFDSGGRSVIDYVLCKEEDFDYVSGVEIGELTVWSDHKPLSCCIYSDPRQREVPVQQGTRKKCTKLCWSEQKKSEAKIAMSDICEHLTTGMTILTRV